MADAPARAGGDFLTRKRLGLPTWSWVALGGVVVAAYLYIKHKQSTASSTPTGAVAAGSSGDQGGGFMGGGGGGFNQGPPSTAPPPPPTLSAPLPPIPPLTNVTPLPSIISGGAPAVTGALPNGGYGLSPNDALKLGITPIATTPRTTLPPATGVGNLYTTPATPGAPTYPFIYG